MNNHGRPQNATAPQDERAHELAEQLNLLKAVDRRITPERLERRFHELAKRLGDADLSAPADVNRHVLRESGIQRAGLRLRRLPKILRWLPVSLFAVDTLLQDDDTGSRRTGNEPKADKHRARRARRGSGRFEPSRWTDAVALAAAAVLTIALVIAGVVFGLRFPVAPGSRPAAAGPYPAAPAVSVVFAATATANEPAPTLSANTLQVLQSAADSSAGAAADIVSPSDGQSTVLPLTPRGSNALQNAEALKANADAVERALDNEATAGQLNLLATITAATRATSRPGTLIVVSSGLSTAGGFDLIQVGWGADPSSVAAQLKASGLLPDLAGWRVVFVGLGVVAGRQPALPPPQQVTLAAYWTAICEASGAASCNVDHSARPQLASHVTGQVPVVPVPVVASVRGPDAAITTTLPASLLFPFNSSTLVPSADTILQPLAQRARDQNQMVSITGYTSPDGGSNAYNLALSAKRADAVRDRLVALGLPAKQITQVIGAGTAGEGPDACIVNGHLDEAICAQLRRVVVILSPAKANP
jgi:outer membrane protein OmpA-like peptidoglycan-associated protein